MVLLVKLVAIAIIIYGCVLTLKPVVFKSIIKYVESKKSRYVSIGMKIFLGLVFLVAASECRISWVVRFFGAAGVLGGAVALLLKESVVDDIIKWAEEISESQILFFGTVALVLGVLLVLAA